MAKSEMCSLMEPRLNKMKKLTKSTSAGVFVVVCGGVGWAWPQANASGCLNVDEDEFVV